MNANMQAAPGAGQEQRDYASFYVGGLLVGVNILNVQEINRQLDMTVVPHAPEWVRGVINLRGEVVTVVDLRMILGLEPTQITPKTRNVIVMSQGEQIALLVDRISDVVTAKPENFEETPANVSGVDGRFFEGICKLDGQLLVMLKVEEVLGAEVGETYTRQGQQ